MYVGQRRSADLYGPDGDSGLQPEFEIGKAIELAQVMTSPYLPVEKQSGMLSRQVVSFMI
jgi:hypothetical protein